MELGTDYALRAALDRPYVRPRRKNWFRARVSHAVRRDVWYWTEHRRSRLPCADALPSRRAIWERERRDV